MASNDIAKRLRRQPFQPLRIHLSSGATYEVFEPWHAGLWATELFIGIDPDDSGIPQRSIYCDTRLVEAVEPLPNGPAPRRNGQ